MNKRPEQPITLPALPLRDVVVYPCMVAPLSVGRPKSIAALKTAMAKNMKVFLITQKDVTIDAPQTTDFYPIGTIATILQLTELPDGAVKVVVEGNIRAEIKEFIDDEEHFSAVIEMVEDEMEGSDIGMMSRTLMTQYVLEQVLSEVVTDEQVIKGEIPPILIYEGGEHDNAASDK